MHKIYHEHVNKIFTNIKIETKDISTVYLYRRHNPTTLQKNLHLNQKGFMNQLLASI